MKEEKEKSGYPVSLFVGLAIAIICVIFVLQNAEEVEIDLLFWDINMALALVILISLILGIIIATIFSLPSRIKMKREIKQLRKEQKLNPETLPKNE